MFRRTSESDAAQRITRIHRKRLTPSKTKATPAAVHIHRRFYTQMELSLLRFHIRPRSFVCLVRMLFIGADRRNKRSIELAFSTSIKGDVIMPPVHQRGAALLPAHLQACVGHRFDQTPLGFCSSRNESRPKKRTAFLPRSTVYQHRARAAAACFICGIFG